MRTVLGIDPGYARVGYGLVSGTGHRLRLIECGCIVTSKDQAFPQRLQIIYDKITQIIAKHKPDSMAIEELFFVRNVTTGIDVAQARGVIMLAGTQADMPIYGYRPIQIKQGVVGYGKATKDQVSKMVATILNLRSTPRYDDTTDAIACAICHFNTNR